MPEISLTPKLKDEYQRLFDTCSIRPEREDQVKKILSQITQNRSRYAAAGDPLGIPWFFVGVIHSLEASLNFKTHLHNGDPLTQRTVQVPQGRPKTGTPPFTWEESAADALKLKNLDKVTEWSLPQLLFQLERYNGFGYRRGHPEVLTPYLWSFSSHYTRGKFVKDGVFSPTAVSQQCGSAVLLRRMAETGAIQFSVEGHPLPDATPDANNGADNGETTGSDVASLEPLVKFSNTEKSTAAEELQKALNNFPGIFVKVDGVPGSKTSDAFKKVTGHFLMGDPRA